MQWYPWYATFKNGIESVGQFSHLVILKIWTSLGICFPSFQIWMQWNDVKCFQKHEFQADCNFRGTLLQISAFKFISLLVVCEVFWQYLLSWWHHKSWESFLSRWRPHFQFHKNYVGASVMDKKKHGTTACCTLFITIKLILWWWWMYSMYHFRKTWELCSESSLSEWLFSSISIVWRAPCWSRSLNLEQGSAEWVLPLLSRTGFLSAVITTPLAVATQSFGGLLMTVLRNTSQTCPVCSIDCGLQRLFLLHRQIFLQSVVLHTLNTIRN